MGKSAIMSVRITGNSDEAVKAFEKATKHAAAFGSAVGNLAAKGIGAAFDAIKNLSGEVMNMSDSTQKFASTMSFAGLDTGAIDAAKKATRAYADATVYDLDTVQNTTAQLAANGVQDFVGLTKAVGNLNAVAGGNADTFQSVAMVMTQTAGAGKLTTENWNQLANAIPGASGKLQDALKKNGAFTGDFRDAMAKGQITADEFNQAIMDLGMTDVAKEAATSTKTMEGALGNLEAAITGGLSDAFDLVKPMVTDAMSVAADKISEFSGKAVSGMKGVVAFLKDGSFTSDLRDAFNIEEDSPIFEFFSNLRQTAIGTFNNAQAAVGDFINAFMATGPVQSAVDLFGTVWDAIRILWDGLSAIADQFQPALQPLINGLSDAGNMGQVMGDALGGAMDIVGGIVMTLGDFGDWVSRNAPLVTTALVAIGGGFAAFQVASVIQTVVAALQGFSSAATLASIGQWALNIAMNANPVMLLVTAIGAVVAALAWFFTMTDTGKAVWSAFTSFLSGCVNGIVGFFQSIPGAIGGVFQSAATTAQNIWNGVVGFFQSIPSKIGGFFSGIASAISSPFQAAFNAIRSFWNSTVGGFGFDIPDWVPGVGGKSFRIPMLATGGIIRASGTVMVGERGPELLTLPAGAQVTPLSRASYGSDGGTVFNITVNGAVDPQGVALQLRRILNDWERVRN